MHLWPNRQSVGPVCALVLFAAASANAQVNCCASGVINTFVNDDVIAMNCSCRIGPSGDVNGGIIQSGDGSVVVQGRCNDIEESGPGGVIVRSGGLVKGNVAEADGGGINVASGGSVEGKLEEMGTGSIRVAVGGGGQVKGDAEEAGAGSVFVTTVSGDYEGSVIELDGGRVDVTVGAGTSFKGGVEEDGPGRATALVNGFFEGDIKEMGSGNVSTSGTGTFKGNTEHELPGTCVNTIVAFEGNPCEL